MTDVYKNLKVTMDSPMEGTWYVCATDSGGFDHEATFTGPMSQERAQDYIRAVYPGAKVTEGNTDTGEPEWPSAPETRKEQKWTLTPNYEDGLKAHLKNPNQLFQICQAADVKAPSHVENVATGEVFKVIFSPLENAIAPYVIQDSHGQNYVRSRTRIKDNYRKVTEKEIEQRNKSRARRYYKGRKTDLVYELVGTCLSDDGNKIYVLKSKNGSMHGTLSAPFFEAYREILKSEARSLGFPCD